ncbi:hypothetical protein EV183_001024 [Coemansia sp. RSA 2336]|nr:hypothetical protein EV183_001024 [Coemansia sp. RSA 2336]
MYRCYSVALVVLFAGIGGRGSGPCDSPIYCQGELLHTVQMAKIFADDKTFVDKPTLKPVSQVLAEFAQIGGTNATRESLVRFVEANFGEEGGELKPVEVTELDTNPPFLAHVNDPLVRAFGHTVNGYWSQLIREQDFSGLCDGCVSSMLQLKYHFVVPGGRFREIYYWDTYFALEGMLRSGLVKLSQSNIRNLLALVDQYGFVPNGARVYYLDRSQPPLLTLMVKLYYEFTGDLAFVAEALPLLQREHQYWMQVHSVDVPCGAAGGTVRLSRYFVNTDQPRPESYSDDYDLAHNVSKTDLGKQAEIYANMATGAESGWDFSTRWVRDIQMSKDKILETISTQQVVPVELNAILYQVEMALAEMNSLLQTTPMEDYQRLASERRQAMEHVMLDEATGLYFDYHLYEHKRSSQFVAASIWPYWAFESTNEQQAKRAFDYIAQVLSKNPGEIPATLVYSGQQWDWPMAWPPLQYVAMQGALLHKQFSVALQLAQAYLNSVFCAWYATGGSLVGILEKLPNTTDSGHIFEKFNSAQVGMQGGGGEYDVQAGFGWTNGVLLWALDKFGPQLTAPAC